jgi:flagellar protein FliS
MDAKSSYREAAVRGASPVQLVICLYDQAISDLRGAIVALGKGDIEARTRGINHALNVVGHLHGSLDLERGGKVARNLYRFYSLVRAGLIEAQLRQSAKILELQISHLAQVRESWLEVERASAPAKAALPASPSLDRREPPVTDWSA